MVGLDDFYVDFGMKDCAEGRHQNSGGPWAIGGGVGYYHCSRCGQNYIKPLSGEERNEVEKNLNRLGPSGAMDC